MITGQAENTTTTSAAGEGSPSSSYSLSQDSSTSSPPPAIILSPCAACKILRRRCAEKCVLAPYFPPTEPLKFTIAHRVFGASNIIKLLQELPDDQRADAVNSMVYEANARLRDPVYGCAGAICQLQKQISELQAQLAKAQAQVLNMHCQNANLFELICQHTQLPLDDQQSVSPQPLLPNFFYDNSSSFCPDDSILGLWA
ncbi:LOB domain-containing protein 1-like [Dorcoceras hygrometricum]|uniref:LOB domain-containing protein 1-like n=1 Tax=Dorcoceras hygrometricum TaxID=472368 RepID=A0A2Z7BRX2_9LAMI|nr:LOB domain-containing protein 1-like [Dorcoceras hygrometricum]